ncbi:19S proteasome regulatory subunit Rpn6 [Microbotryum lychnidis-dioicae p1A1 Lamole]|uniref:19S proteasome regulatory subunit Rpn6 n=1 Tax=Microbotryum lychnidis-dioicae (strain p1A1 Lamole / MvSl-1064) TaxID=683840 RepID=U5HHH7_USTV1|nr:19S proteasome regulatory subunit Rpn6 [Microbotryum lychnidis-dioicae p1A1 Lamole]|eukprot:KDE02974.1 19S proteasome regulatory subunit Rpn6 [Microbotryum lychnidis-dioicae p1A1 Lamole]
MSSSPKATTSTPARTEQQLRAILDQPVDGPQDDQLLKEKETAIVELGQLYSARQDATALAQLIRDSTWLMQHLAKAKTAKLVRTLLDQLSAIPNSSALQIKVTQENVDWARSEKRIFLKQNLETRLIALYIDNQNYKDALALITTLLRELKKLDDKMVLTEVHLLESRVNHLLANMPKAKAALTSARTAANSIYCPPLLQAQLDMQSGILHAEDKDYKTAFSYFFEALEGLSSQDDPKAPAALKYMLMCKVMLNLPEDVTSIIAGKLAQRYAGPQVDAIKAVAKAHEDRSLSDFERLLKEHRKELSDDPIIRNHLSALYDTLLEQNLVRIIEPFSRVEISHIAELVGQPVRDVEAKLSQMILDKVFDGILDQGAGCLIVWEEPEVDKTYDATLETLGHISHIVDQLFTRTRSM